MSSNPDTMFTLLDQAGPFTTLLAAPPMDSVFSDEGRSMVRKIREGRQQTKYRVIRNQIFDLLDVRSFEEINHLIFDSGKRSLTTEKAYRMLGNMFGISGRLSEMTATINNYSRTADGVIRYLQNRVLTNFASHIEITNEIDLLSSPVDLLLILFDRRYHQKARFEAKRKLLLMNLAGAIDQRERETNIEAKFSHFLDFLNQYVWVKELTIGELDPVYVLSRHAGDDFSCISWQLIDRQEAAGIEPAPSQKLTLLKRRRFHSGGRVIPISVSIRKKSPEAKVLKLLRKAEENPAVAVDDELGLMAVAG